MEKISLHYYPQKIEFDLNNLDYEIAEPHFPESNIFEVEILINAIYNDMFDKFVNDAKNPLIIVNDRQRPTPTLKILPLLKPLFDKNPRFIIACGTHSEPNEKEMKDIFGEYYDRFKNNITANHSKVDKYKKVLHSKDNFDFELNEIITKSDCILTINSVEPHYFAGFTGGRKSFLPGIASYNTIKQNHKFSLHPNSKTLALENNPVHLNMMELSNYMDIQKNIFSIQTVLRSDGSIYSAYAGIQTSAFTKAVEDARNFYGVPIKKKADIVITVSSNPQDSRMYQSFKALDNGSVAMKDDGILILLSSCHNGIGNAEFSETARDFKTPQDVLNSKDFTYEGYKLGYQRILRLARWGVNGNLWLVSNMNDDEAKSIFFRPFKDLKDAINKALEIKGKNAHIVIIPNGILTVPYVKS